FGFNRLKSAKFYQPNLNTVYYHTFNSESYEAEVDYPLIEELRIRTGFMLLNNRFGEAPPAIASQSGDGLDPGFFGSDSGFDPRGAYRGLTQSFYDRVWRVGLSRDTRTNEHIPLDGDRLDAWWQYHHAGRDH